MDVNEQPEFDGSSVSLVVAENTVANTNIGDPVTASDPESAALSYSLVGVDASSFDIDSSSGQIKTKGPLDHDSLGDSGGDNAYEAPFPGALDGVHLHTQASDTIRQPET